MRSAEQLLMSDNTFARKAKRKQERQLAVVKMAEIRETEMLPAINENEEAAVETGKSFRA